MVKESDRVNSIFVGDTYTPARVVAIETPREACLLDHWVALPPVLAPACAAGGAHLLGCLGAVRESGHEKCKHLAAEGVRDYGTIFSLILDSTMHAFDLSISLVTLLLLLLRYV